MSAATSIGSSNYQKKMRRKDNYVMMKRVTPKRVTLPDGRTFVGRFKRVPRSRLPPRKNKKKVQRCTFEAKG